MDYLDVSNSELDVSNKNALRPDIAPNYLDIAPYYLETP